MTLGRSGLRIALALSASVITILITLVPPAAAMAGPPRSGSTTLVGQNMAGRGSSGSPRAGTPGEPNLVVLTVLGGIPLVIVLRIIARPGAERRRMIRQFRAELRDLDVVSVCRRPSSGRDA